MKNLRNVMLLFAASAAMIACQNNGKTAANAAGNDSAATDTVAVDTDGFALHIQSSKAQAKPEDYTGKKVVETKKVDGKDVTVYKFALGKDTTYFKVVNDSTLRMVNDQAEEAASKLSYDLKLKK